MLTVSIIMRIKYHYVIKHFFVMVHVCEVKMLRACVQDVCFPLSGCCKLGVLVHTLNTGVLLSTQGS